MVALMVSAVGRIDDKAYKISKLMTPFLRLADYLGEDDGAIECEHPEQERWTKRIGVNHLEKGSDKKRFQTATASFSTCVLFKAVLEGTRVIHLCSTLWKFRTTGLITSVTLVFLMSITDCRRERFERRTGNRILNSSGSHK